MNPSALIQRHVQLWESAAASHRMVVLVRHGETDWNATKRFQGHTDIPLNPLGIEQAKALASHIRQLEIAIQRPIAQRCVSSDLGRAHETARILWDGKHDLLLDPRLRERNYGDLSGLTGDEMALQHPEAFKGLKSRDPHSPLPGGESLHQFNQRVLQAFHTILASHPEEDLLLVAHGGVLDCIYRLCKAEPLEKHRDWLLPNAALNLLQVKKVTAKAAASSISQLASQSVSPVPEILLWADHSHLMFDQTGEGHGTKDEVDGRIA